MTIDVEKLKEAGIVSIRDELISRERQGAEVARTESGDPSFDVPPAVQLAITKALFNGRTHYTAGSGIPELLQAAAKKVTRENGIITEPSGVIITNGAMHGLYVVFQAILDKGGDVLVPTPTWTETVTNVTLAGGTPRYYGLDPFADDPIDIGELESLITSQTRAIVINTPHNPTGRVLRYDLLADIVDLCEERDLYLISDEAYEHLTYGCTHASAAGIRDRSKNVSIFSCSKSYAMSGLRVGYVVTSDAGLMRKLRMLLRCTANGINSIAQHGAAAALSKPDPNYMMDMKAHYLYRRKLLVDALVEHPWFEPVNPEGAFYVWARISDAWTGLREGWAVTAKLLEHNVGSAPGDVFGPGGAGHVRFAFSCATDHVERAVGLLKGMK